jgi:hypothetical protein
LDAVATKPAQRFALIRAVMRWLLAAFFVAAGVAHLAVPETLLTITPDWVPFAPQVIYITGLCELAGAPALVTRPLRRWLLGSRRDRIAKRAGGVNSNATIGLYQIVASAMALRTKAPTNTPPTVQPRNQRDCCSFMTIVPQTCRLKRLTAARGKGSSPAAKFTGWEVPW